jgi:demethylmenaquinone methyltransferase/2-methoxy-6-polyprenyl-1,4-benzoquinol methylase
MFNSIHKTYDFLNHLLSFGLDIYWRKKALINLSIPTDGVCLDLAAGTGDFGLEVFKKFKCKIIGYDFAEKPLRRFRQKSNKKGFSETDFFFVNGEAESLSIKSNSIDLITIAFGIRNFHNSQTSLNEMYRSLKNGGILNILEFSMPQNKFFLSVYQFYFRKVLPMIGRIISSDDFAYRYLPYSVGNFEKEKDLISEITAAHFQNLEVKSFTFGVVALYRAVKVK